MYPNLTTEGVRDGKNAGRLSFGMKIENIVMFAPAHPDLWKALGKGA